MIPTGYWMRPDTPQFNSPVGRIMRQLEIFYPEADPAILREMARERVNTNGPGQVKWSREERKRLKEWADLPVSGSAELFPTGERR